MRDAQKILQFCARISCGIEPRENLLVLLQIERVKAVEFGRVIQQVVIEKEGQAASEGIDFLVTA